VLVGFDGFVDEIVTPVAARHGPAEDYVPFASIADFAEPIASAGGGRNANIEVAPPWKNLGAMGRKAIDMDEVLADTLSRHLSRAKDFLGVFPVMLGSKEILPLLIPSYEVFITTAAMEYPTSFAAKYEWIKEHFPFFPDSHIVFCRDKSIIVADFLVDDNVHHFGRFKNL
jgi:5'(3')-deoxyribonucleotidase